MIKIHINILHTLAKRATFGAYKQSLPFATCTINESFDPIVVEGDGLTL